MRSVLMLITTLIISACSGGPPPDTFVTCAHDAADRADTGKGKGCGA